MTNEIPRYTLNDSNTLPVIGFGTVSLRDDSGTRSILNALETGYRLLDTAVNYENEKEVGDAVRQSGLDRDEVQITSKIPGKDHSHDAAMRSVEGTLRRLGTDYLDLGLIHWPNPRRGRYLEAWQALINQRERGLVRSIGVSNFTEEHLSTIIDETGVVPTVNQIELHPYLPQQEMLTTNASLGIRTESWSPLTKTRSFDEPAVVSAAEAHDVSPAQVVLRWHIQLGALPIPKSGDADRQRTNIDIFGFELTDSEMVAITELARPSGRIFGGDPETHEEL
ncbi:MAG: aldo/keto reductase [Acidimicrobiia bacterium]|nr:aldo/keto reductase [Acidimicrobiia bacterium]